MGFKNFGVYRQIHNTQKESASQLPTELITQMMSSMSPNFNFNQTNTSQTTPNEEFQNEPQDEVLKSQAPFIQTQENNLTNTITPLFPQPK